MDATATVTGPGPSERGPWWADPRLRLAMLSPGQRYTAAIVGGLAVAMLTIGIPRGSTDDLASYILPRGAAQAGLTPRTAAPAAAPATPAAEPVALAPPVVAPAPAGAAVAPPPPAPRPTPAPSPSPAPSSPPPSSPPPSAGPAPVPALPVPLPGLGQ